MTSVTLGTKGITGAFVGATHVTGVYVGATKVWSPPPVQVILTSGTSWTVPADWNSANNTIECIGAGGNDTIRAGGGGAYAGITNLTLTPGATVAFQIGMASSTAANSGTWFVSTTTVYADGAVGYTRGQAFDSVGETVFSGGLGYRFATNTGTYVTGGGGGAAGAHGEGISGTANAGGAGDAGFGGAGGVSGSAGGDGTEWGSAGSGGGGFGPTNGGNYGAGGGASQDADNTFHYGAGAPGVIVITYQPA